MELLEGLSIGGSTQIGKQPWSAGNYYGYRNRYGAMATYKYDKLKLSSEFIYQTRERIANLDDEEAYGWFVMGTYMLIPKLQGVVKYELYDPDRDADDDRQDVLTLGGTYFLNENIKFELNYRLLFEEGNLGGDTNNELIAQTQIKF